MNPMMWQNPATRRSNQFVSLGPKPFYQVELRLGAQLDQLRGEAATLDCDLQGVKALTTRS